MDHEVYLTLEDLSKRLNVTEVYLSCLIKKGKLPEISDEELTKFAEEEEKKAKEEEKKAKEEEKKR